MEYIVHENETSRLSSEPSNSRGQWPQAGIDTASLPENLGVEAMDAGSAPMGARNDAGVANEAHPLTIVPSMEPARALEAWSEAERDALALGSYIFKSNADKVAAVVGTKTAPQVRSYYDTAPATLRGHSNLDMSQELDTEAGGLLSPSRLEAKVLQMCAASKIAPAYQKLLWNLVEEYNEQLISTEDLLAGMIQLAGRDSVVNALDLPGFLAAAAPSPSPSPSPQPEQPAARFAERTATGAKQCENCGTNSTPLWRKDRHINMLMCNACGIYYKNHGKHRPVELAVAPPRSAPRREYATSTAAAAAGGAVGGHTALHFPQSAPVPSVSYDSGEGWEGDEHGRDGEVGKRRTVKPRRYRGTDSEGPELTGNESDGGASDLSSVGLLGEAQAERLRGELIERLVTHAVPADFDEDGAVKGLAALKKARLVDPGTGQSWGVVRIYADPGRSTPGSRTAAPSPAAGRSAVPAARPRAAAAVAASRLGQTCENCGTNSTPLWRKDRDTGVVLCNACGIYLKTHGKNRPLGTSRHRQTPSERAHHHHHGGSLGGSRRGTPRAAAAAAAQKQAAKRRWEASESDEEPEVGEVAVQEVEEAEPMMQPERESVSPMVTQQEQGDVEMGAGAAEDDGETADEELDEEENINNAAGAVTNVPVGFHKGMPTSADVMGGLPSPITINEVPSMGGATVPSSVVPISPSPRISFPDPNTALGSAFQYTTTLPQAPSLFKRPIAVSDISFTQQQQIQQQQPATLSTSSDVTAEGFPRGPSPPLGVARRVPVGYAGPYGVPFLFHSPNVAMNASMPMPAPPGCALAVGMSLPPSGGRPPLSSMGDVATPMTMQMPGMSLPPA